MVGVATEFVWLVWELSSTQTPADSRTFFLRCQNLRLRERSGSYIDISLASRGTQRLSKESFGSEKASLEDSLDRRSETSSPELFDEGKLFKKSRN